MFSIGDGHYRQGEGESCGTAVEGAMDSVILVDLIKGNAPAWPKLENDDYWMVVGSSRPMEDAWRISQVEMVHWLTDLLKIDYMDAYQLVTQTSLCPIANCVDTNYSVVTKIPKLIMPKADAFHGMHEKLRDLAKSVRLRKKSWSATAGCDFDKEVNINGSKSKPRCSRAPSLRNVNSATQLG
jgi:hypothetical protein